MYAHGISVQQDWDHQHVVSRMNKYLFLDIDGVLSLYETGSGFYSLNKSRLRLLSELIKETGCLIVLTSTWRLDAKALRIFNRKIAYRGLTVFSQTPHLPNESREVEIRTWLEMYASCAYRYAILDDLVLNGFDEKFFKTNPRKGLTSEIKDSIVHLLNRES